jgi:hypothetical protein
MNDVCQICHEEGDEKQPLYCFCDCTAKQHTHCLQQWLNAGRNPGIACKSCLREYRFTRERVDGFRMFWLRLCLFFTDPKARASIVLKHTTLVHFGSSLLGFLLAAYLLDPYHCPTVFTERGATRIFADLFLCTAMLVMMPVPGSINMIGALLISFYREHWQRRAACIYLREFCDVACMAVTLAGFLHAIAFSLFAVYYAAHGSIVPQPVAPHEP